MNLNTAASSGRKNISVVSAVLLGLSLSGCAADAETANARDERTGGHTHYAFINADQADDGAKHYSLEIRKEDGSEPIVITTDDPESEEFQAALADLKGQGIDIDLDFDPADLHDEDMIEFKSDDMDVEGMKFFIKDGEITIDGKVISELEGADRWTSDDGSLHVIKKAEDGSTVMHVTNKDGTNKVFVLSDHDIPADGKPHQVFIEKKVFITKDEEDTGAEQ